MMMTQLLTAMILVAAPADQTPAAMLLAADGKVTLTRTDGTSRAARVMDILYVDDKLSIEGEARVVILGDGHKEKLTGEVTLAEEGGSPDDRVTREPGRLSAAHLAGLKNLARTGRGGVVVPRGNLEPLLPETVLGTRPKFTWKEAEPLGGYTFKLYRKVNGGEKELFERSGLLEAALVYPENEPPLERGEEYRFVVNGTTSGSFHVATDDEIARAEELKGLAGSDQPEDWLLAATTLHSMRMYAPARALFGKLASKFPQEPAYLMALAQYLHNSGDVDGAESLVEKANSLIGKKD